MRRGLAKHLFLIALIFAATAGFVFLRSKPVHVAPEIIKSDSHKSTDFDAVLLAEAAKKYTDPNDIADIPDQVIIEDFINIAFSDHNWISDYPWYDGESSNLLMLGYAKNYYSRIITPEHTPPSSNKINKVRINSGFKISDSGFGPHRNRIIRSHTPSIFKLISEETGLELKQVAKARSPVAVLRYWGHFWQVGNPFKFREYPAKIKEFKRSCEALKKFDVNIFGYMDACSYPYAFQHAFKKATRFTPHLKAQVEGYFFSNARNEIDGGECWFHSSNKNEPFLQEITQALAVECVVRLLGLPDHSLLFESAVLGRWGRRFESLVIPVVPAGVSDKIRTYKDLVPEARDKGAARLIFLRRINIAASSARLPIELTKYDRLILRILYNSRIKPGMSIGEVRALLPLVLADARTQNQPRPSTHNRK